MPTDQFAVTRYEISTHRQGRQARIAEAQGRASCLNGKLAAWNEPRPTILARFSGAKGLLLSWGTGRNSSAWFASMGG
jgi:hypothetical protein